ncbi:MAG: KH domain-containing protein [Acidimicrobiia bacterium]|nr:KH domain-containing protein [Acidimicrobiia bacterium]
MRAVAEVVARALVDRPDAVRIVETSRRGSVVLQLSTAPGDLGKLIGRQGRTAAALRTLVGLASERAGVRATLDLRD